MKIGIIGVGNVGSATAFALVLRGVAREVILIDVNEEKAIAEALDISHATTFAYASKVRAGEYSDLTCADVVIISAGANQKPGETRIALLERNVEPEKIFVLTYMESAARNFRERIKNIFPDTEKDFLLQFDEFIWSAS